MRVNTLFLVSERTSSTHGGAEALAQLVERHDAAPGPLEVGERVRFDPGKRGGESL